MRIFWKGDSDEHRFEYMNNLDELIKRLQELTQPQPKYIHGWVIDGFGKM